MEQAEIMQLLKEAADPNCPGQRVTSIQCLLGHASPAMGSDGVFRFDSSNGGLLSVVDRLFTQTYKNCRQKFPDLFPVFALICGGKDVDIDWSLMEKCGNGKIRRCFVEQENYILSAKRVNEIYNDCLWSEDKFSNEDALQVFSGVMRKAFLSKTNLKKHEEEIFKMLIELPDEFMQSKGGGWAFVNACIDKNNNQWAEQQTMEYLFMLGIGIDKVKAYIPLGVYTYFVVLD